MSVESVGERDRPAEESRCLNVSARSARFLMPIVVFLCLWPYLGRIGWPSLYHDDIARVAFRETETLGQSLFRPFNEHIAPLFEAVTWATWGASGRDLAAAPLFFTLSSYLPFLLCLAILAALARAELGDGPAAPIALAVFALSSLSNETVFWYSAASFTWALAFTLLAWLASARAVGSGRGGWFILAALASLAAPAFCGLGLLAGPLSMVRLWAGRKPQPQPGGWPGFGTPTPGRNGLGMREVPDPGLPRPGSTVRGSEYRTPATQVPNPLSDGGPGQTSAWACLVPMVGTGVYLAIALAYRFRGVMARSVEHNLSLGRGLLCVARAPVDLLIPGLVGLPNLDPIMPTAVELGLFAAFLIGLATWFRQTPGARPSLLLGVGLILGGYGLTFPLRASADLGWLLTVQRYHLFPQAGLALIVAAGLAPILSRLADRWRSPDLAVIAPLALTVALLLIHSPGIKRHARFFRYPEQARTLAAFERLADTARRLGVSRPQALAALDPIRNAWTPEPRLFNAWQMLPAWDSPDSPAPEVRTLLLSALTPQDREALCGGMDATPYLASTPAELLPSEPGRAVKLSQARPLAAPGRFEAKGELAFVEFDFPASPSAPRSLLLDAPAEGEIWWADADGAWSPSRSFTWVAPESPTGWLLPLSQIPHWTAKSAVRLRVLTRKKGPVAMGTPRMIR